MVGVEIIPIDFEQQEVMATFSDAHTLLDSGATSAIAGRGWLDKMASRMARYGLTPVKEEVRQTVRGLGGVK